MANKSIWDDKKFGPLLGLSVGVFINFILMQRVDFSWSYPMLGLIIGLIIALWRKK